VIGYQQKRIGKINLAGNRLENAMHFFDGMMKEIKQMKMDTSAR